MKKSPRRFILHLNPKEKCCVILFEEILEELLLERASNSRHFFIIEKQARLRAGAPAVYFQGGFRFWNRLS